MKMLNEFIWMGGQENDPQPHFFIKRTWTKIDIHVYVE